MTDVTKGVERMKRDQAAIREIVKEKLSISSFSLVELLKILSEHHWSIHQKTFTLAMDRVGVVQGVEHIRYAPLILGSGARGEQLLFSDQDHAFIYDTHADVPPSFIDWKAYFSQISHVYSALLYELGYPLCSGNVMMSNPRWRGTASEWEERIQEYSDQPIWENIRFLLIALEARPLIGDPDLYVPIQKLIANHIASSRYMCWKIADQGLMERIPGIKLTKRKEPYRDVEIAVKERLYTPLVNIVRLWALHTRIDAISTFKRLEQIKTLGVWPQTLADDVTSALVGVLSIRLRQQWRKVGVEGDQDPSLWLSNSDVELLNEAFVTLRKLLRITAKFFPWPRR